MKIRLEPTKKQFEVWEALKTYSDIFFGGGAGGGKSWIICETRATNAYLYPGYKSFIGREELKRLMASTYITWCKVCKHHSIPQSDWKLNGQYNYIEFKNGSRIDLLDVKYIPSDPLYERFGSLEYSDGALEECGEIHYLAYDVLKSRIGRHLNMELNIPVTILMTGNPKKNWTYTKFYKPNKTNSLPDNAKFIQSLYNDNPYTSEIYGKQLSAITDKVLRERLKDGNWEYDSDTTNLIEFDKITDIFTNTFIQDGQPYLTCDVARLGKDTSTIGIWSGLRLIKIITIDKCLVTELAYKIRDLSYSHHIPLSNVIVDEDGVGGGVKDILGCKGFVNNSRSVSGNYANLKSECYYTLAKYINESNLFINTNEDEKLKTMIIEELEQVKSKDEITEGKLAVISKEEVKKLIGRSPDNSDMIMMRMYFEIYKQTQYVDYG